MSKQKAERMIEKVDFFTKFEIELLKRIPNRLKIKESVVIDGDAASRNELCEIIKANDGLGGRTVQWSLEFTAVDISLNKISRGLKILLEYDRVEIESDRSYADPLFLYGDKYDMEFLLILFDNFFFKAIEIGE